MDVTANVELLLVEDSPTDALLAEEAFAASNLAGRVHRVEDGEQAIAFLYRRGPYQSSPRPGMIVLDLNLPRKSGFEVLREVKADAGLKTIPVIVLTTSRDEQDIRSSYGLHANCYVVKPLDFSQYGTVVKAIDQFWSGVAVLPPPP